MRILTISGSARSGSSNIALLKALASILPQHQLYNFEQLYRLPLFTANDDKAPFAKTVLAWRNEVKQADALIIVTPEYLHGIPALLKNAFEWLSSSGELFEKPVLPITFTPHPPRGEKAMQALLNTLNALKARVVGQLDLYKNDVTFDKDGKLNNNETIKLLKISVSQFC